MTLPLPRTPLRAGVPALIAGLLLAAPALANCPDPAATGAILRMEAGDAAPQALAWAGGTIDLRNCGQVNGHGRINPIADYTIRYDARGSGRTLGIRGEAACDAVLLVADPAGRWHFNDDSQGLNPGMQLHNAASGDYRVWLGTFSSTGAGCEGTLTLDTTAAPGPQGSGRNSGACPNWQLGGAEMVLERGGAGRQALTAGGATALFNNACNIQAHGHVAAAPDFTLRLRGEGSGTLTLRASGDCDTVLLLNDASARWHFNDDSQGLDPQLRIQNAGPGRYDIWVGTYGSSLCRAEFSADWQAGGGLTK